MRYQKTPNFDKIPQDSTKNSLLSQLLLHFVVVAELGGGVVLMVVVHILLLAIKLLLLLNDSGGGSGGRRGSHRCLLLIVHHCIWIIDGIFWIVVVVVQKGNIVLERCNCNGICCGAGYHWQTTAKHKNLVDCCGGPEYGRRQAGFNWGHQIREYTPNWKFAKKIFRRQNSLKSETLCVNSKRTAQSKNLKFCENY